MSDSGSSSDSTSSSSSSLSSSPVSSSPVASSSTPHDDSATSDSNRVSAQESSSLQFALSTEDNHAMSGTPADHPMSMSQLVAVPEPGDLHVSSGNSRSSSENGSMSSSRASSSPSSPSSSRSISPNGSDEEDKSETHYSESGRAPDPEIPFLPSPPPADTTAAAKRTATSLPPLAAKPKKQQQHQQSVVPVISRPKLPTSATNQPRASTGQPKEAARSRSSLPPIGAHRVPTAPPKPHRPQPKRRKPSPSKKAVVSSSYGNIYRYPFPRVARSPPKTAKRSGWLVSRSEMEESALSIDKTPKHPHPPKSADQARDGRSRHIEDLLAPNRPHDAAPPTGRRAQRYAAKWLQLHDDHEPSRPDGIMRSLDIARDGKTNRHQVGVNNPLQFEFNPYQSAANKDNEEDGTVLAIEGREDGELTHVRGGRIVTPEGEESARRPDSEEVSVHSDAPQTNQTNQYDQDAHDTARWLVDFSLRYACDWHARDSLTAIVTAPPSQEDRPRVNDDVPAAAIWATQFALSRAIAANDEDVTRQALEDASAAAALTSTAEEELEEEDPQTRAERLLVAGCVDRAIDKAIGIHTMWEFHASLERDESGLEASTLIEEY